MEIYLIGVFLLTGLCGALFYWKTLSVPRNNFDRTLDVLVGMDKEGLIESGDVIKTDLDKGIIFLEYGKHRFSFERKQIGDYSKKRPDIYRTLLYVSVYDDKLIVHLDDETIPFNCNEDCLATFIKVIREKVDNLNVDKSKKYYESIRNKEKKKLNRKRNTEYLGTAQ